MQKEKASGSSKLFGFTLEDLGRGVLDASYLIRGCVYYRARELMALRAKGEKLPFDKFYPLQSGNPQLLGQPPITFIRQVISCVLTPSLLDTKFFPEDVMKRARYYLSQVPNSAVGAYSDAPGFDVFRQAMSKYITERDGFPCDFASVYLIDGTLDGMIFLLNLLLSKRGTGIMIPRPEFPGYSFLAVQAEGKVVSYPLNEEDNWCIEFNQLEEVYEKARKEGINIKVMVVINPSNPTGAVLKQEHLYGIIKFAYEHGILLVADEVYQNNIYAGHEFISLRKAVHSIGPPYNSVSAISLNSISKGYLGEGGIRGGYMEFTNIEPGVLKEIHKIRDPYNINVTGSIVMGIVCDPPTYENASKEVVDLYNKERDDILKSLEAKVRIVMDTFKECKGVKCQPISGALYAFPRVFLPEPVVELAKKEKLKPCEYFCKRMVEDTGIITVPGCVFGQEQGTYHFRMSLLVWDLEEFAKMMQVMKKFINKFFEENK